MEGIFSFEPEHFNNILSEIRDVHKLSDEKLKESNKRISLFIDEVDKTPIESMKLYAESLTNRKLLFVLHALNEADTIRKDKLIQILKVMLKGKNNLTNWYFFQENYDFQNAVLALNISFNNIANGFDEENKDRIPFFLELDNDVVKKVYNEYNKSEYSLAAFMIKYSFLPGSKLTKALVYEYIVNADKYELLNSTDSIINHIESLEFEDVLNIINCYLKSLAFTEYHSDILLKLNEKFGSSKDGTWEQIDNELVRKYNIAYLMYRLNNPDKEALNILLTDIKNTPSNKIVGFSKALSMREIELVIYSLSMDLSKEIIDMCLEIIKIRMAPHFFRPIWFSFQNNYENQNVIKAFEIAKANIIEKHNSDFKDSLLGDINLYNFFTEMNKAMNENSKLIDEFLSEHEMFISSRLAIKLVDSNYQSYDKEKFNSNIEFFKYYLKSGSFKDIVGSVNKYIVTYDFHELDEEIMDIILNIVNFPEGNDNWELLEQKNRDKIASWANIRVLAPYLSDKTTFQFWSRYSSKIKDIVYDEDVKAIYIYFDDYVAFCPTSMGNNKNNGYDELDYRYKKKDDVNYLFSNMAFQIFHENLQRLSDDEKKKNISRGLDAQSVREVILENEDADITEFVLTGAGKLYARDLLNKKLQIKG